MNILIIGFGSMGRRYARLLTEHNTSHIWLYRSDRKHIQSDFPEIYHWSECSNIQFNAVFITNPPFLHTQTVIEIIKHIKCPIFIEKPLTSDLKNITMLISLVKKYSIATYVGYCLRFHPVIKVLREYIQTYRFVSMKVVVSSYLPIWHPNNDWRKGYSSYKHMGGGVLLDLSHEFDYVSYLLGGIKKIRGSFGRVSQLTVNSEDVADIVCHTAKGRAIVHLDYLSHRPERTAVIDFNEISVYADLLHGNIEEWKEGACIKKYTLFSDMDDVYRDQLAYFMKNRNNPDMMNSVFEAIILLKKILSFKNSHMYER